MIDQRCVLHLDVQDLEPPEPLTSILTTLECLDAAQILRVKHRREPLPLYPMLQEMGYEHCAMVHAHGVFCIYIWQSGRFSAADVINLDQNMELIG